MADIYFWRQMFILITILFCAVSAGVMIAFPSILNPALIDQSKSNSTEEIRVTSEQASWIAASNGFSGIFGFFILSPILQKYGRKAVHIFSNIFLIIGWIIFPLANSTLELYIARIIQGLAMGSVYINGMIIGEYSDPVRRGYFITIKNVAISVGPLLCHAFTLFWDWRQISTFTISLSAIGIVLTFLWPESPSYLAMKERIKECEESYIWLRGCSNLKELEALISSQTQNLKEPIQEKWYKFLFKLDFLKPFLIVSLLTLVLDLCGKYYFIVYVIQIMVELIGDQSIAIYCSICADLLILFALIISCGVISYFKRRSMMLVFGIVTVALMLLISLITALKLSDIVWLTPTLILMLSFLTNVGLIPVCFAIIGEVFPLKYKGTGSCLIGIVFTLLYTFMIKITPVLMDYTGVEGVYLTYGLSIAVCLVILFYIVPETKDRALQEIEEEFLSIKKPEPKENINLEIRS